MSSRGPSVSLLFFAPPPPGALGISFFFAGDIFRKNGRPLWAVPKTPPPLPRGQQIIQQTFWQKVFYYLAPTIVCRVGQGQG